MKNNEKIWRWGKILLVIIMALAGVVYGYGRLNHRVETLETQAEEAQKTKEKVIRMEEGIEYIKKAVDEIKEQLK